MFYGCFTIAPGISLSAAQILDQYGIEHDHFGQIIHLPQNNPMLRAMGGSALLHTPLAPGAFYLPFDINVSIIRSQARVDLAHGLGPVRDPGAPPAALTTRCTHGVEIVLERTGLPCRRIRWLQTVRIRNNPEPNQPLEFVDAKGTGLPWYYDEDELDPPRFNTLPCGPGARAKETGLRYQATVAIAAWMPEQVILAQCFTYGFNIEPGMSVRAISWNPPIRSATDAEIQDQIRVLQTGVNRFWQATGGHLTYQLPPPTGLPRAGGYIR